MENAAELEVTVVYATPAVQRSVTVRLPAGASVTDAIEQSGLLETHPEILSAGSAIGIFGEVTAPETQVADGDRIEIYRPLIADPKEARRRRGRRQR